MQLTEKFHVPSDTHQACDRLTTLVARHTRRLLAEEYWSDGHLDAITDHSGESYTYVRDDEYDAFADVEAYLYTRFKRGIYTRVAGVLEAHAEEYRAFQFVLDTVEERPIRRIGWKRLRTRLFEDADSPYIEWGVIEAVVEKLDRYYRRHGRFPGGYTDLLDVPEPNGTLPYSPDGRGDIHDVCIDDTTVTVVVNVPDSLSPATHHDWTDHELTFPTHRRLRAMLQAGEAQSPRLHAAEHGYTIDLPIDVDVDEQAIETDDERVLAVDLGVKKQATVVVLAGNSDGHHDQVTPPQFVDHPAKDKLFRLKADAEGINDRLAELRRQGKAHTDRFDHLLAEYRQTRRKERRLRRQIQHDLANQLVWLAAIHGCGDIVFESLGQIEGGQTEGTVAWSISSWARGELLDYVQYKAELLGIEFETVDPWGTSRYCPRCGERGRTVKAPDDHTECRHGGHFHCRSCGYECDRDVVGAVNVGRKYLSGWKMERANPADYRSAGNHASFPSHSPEECARSAALSEEETDGASGGEPSNARRPSSGVQSATDQQEQASGRQTHLSRVRLPPLTSKRDGTDQGGLQQNDGSEMGMRTPSGSVTRYVLARTTGCSQTLPNTTEN